MLETFICCTSFPNIKQLLCIFATITKYEATKVKQSTLSDYNRTILKCRQVLMENRDVIVCPILNHIYGVYIICKESTYENGTLIKCLQKLKLKIHPPASVQKSIYEDCCYYTLTAKLAPKWNVISNYLIRGRNFLTDNSPTDSVQLVININDNGDTTFVLKVGRIRLLNMSLEKLELTPNQFEELDRNKKIYFRYDDKKTVSVLPSLKQAHVISINRSLIKSSEIQTYEQMRRHWKNTYGYRLPESDTGMNYLQVSFFSGSSVLTYPEICVRTCAPIFLQRIDPEPVVHIFMTDLQKMVPTIFGDKYSSPSYISPLPIGRNKLSYQNENLTPNSAFTFISASRLMDSSFDLNKTSNQLDITSSLTSTNCQSLLTSTRSQSSLTSLESCSSSSLLISKTPESHSEYEPFVKSNIYKQLDFLIKEKRNRENGVSLTGNNESNQTGPKIVPKFTPKFSKSKPSLQTFTTSSTNTNNGIINNGSKFIPKFPIRKKPNTSIQLVENNSNLITDNCKNDIENMNVEPKIVPRFSKSNSVNKSKPVQNDLISAITPEQKICKESVKNSDLKIINLKDTSKKRSMNKNIDDDDNNSNSKKVKIETIDVEAHMKNNTLNKVTVPVLVRWLKDRSVHCPAKSKKSILIQQVTQYLTKKS